MLRVLPPLVLIPALSCCAAAQTPASAPTSQPTAEAEQTEATATRAQRDPKIDEILAAMTLAHRGELAEAVEGFEGKAEITPITEDGDAITLIIDIRFRDPDAIRYKADEGGRRVERGRDHIGPWTRAGVDEPAVSLRKAEYENDRDELEKHIALARQLLRFLDPAEVVGRFQTNVVLGEADLPVARNKIRRCHLLTGIADAFPIYTMGGLREQVELQLWIDRENHRLLGVRSTPYLDGKPTEISEFITMPEHVEQGGLLLPARLIFDVIDADEKRVRAAKVRLLHFDANAELGKSAFDRRSGW